MSYLTPSMFNIYESKHFNFTHIESYIYYFTFFKLKNIFIPRIPYIIH